MPAATGRRTRPREQAQPRTGTTRVATLTRISTDEVIQPYSLEAQAQGLEAFVSSQPGQKITHRFVDPASGATLERPGLQAALAAARAGGVRRAPRLPHRSHFPVDRRAHDHRRGTRRRWRRPALGHRAHRHPRTGRPDAAATARDLRRVRAQLAHRPDHQGLRTKGGARRMARRPRPLRLPPRHSDQDSRRRPRRGRSGQGHLRRLRRRAARGDRARQPAQRHRPAQPRRPALVQPNRASGSATLSTSARSLTASRSTTGSISRSSTATSSRVPKNCSKSAPPTRRSSRQPPPNTC